MSLKEEGRDHVCGESVGDEEIAIGIEEGELLWCEPWWFLRVHYKIREVEDQGRRFRMYVARMGMLTAEVPSRVPLQTPL